MFRRILIAIQDGEERRALTGTAAELAAAGETAALVIHVRKATAVYDPGEIDPESLTLPAVEELKARGLQAEGEVITIDAGREIGRAIADTAAGWRADVVVIGSRRLSDLDAALHGSVSHTVMHFAGCPVVVAPKAGAPAGIFSILLAVDGSKASNAAEAMVATLAREHQARVAVLHVPQPLVVSGPLLAGWYVPPPDAEELRIEAVDRLRAAGIAVTQVPAGGPGTIAATIAAAAEEAAADLIVLGSRGLGGVAALIRGSVSHEVLHETRRAVLVTRANP